MCGYVHIYIVNACCRGYRMATKSEFQSGLTGNKQKIHRDTKKVFFYETMVVPQGSIEESGGVAQD